MIAVLVFALLAGVPESASLILHINSGADHCHGTPIGITQILTAAHCVGSGEIDFEGQGVTGQARLMWRDDKRDVAMMAATVPQQWKTVRIAKRPPVPAAQGYIRTFLPRLRSTSVAVTILGLDDDGDLDVFGFVPPGSSGSGLLDEAGELVGVMKEVFNPYLVGQRPKTALDLLDALRGAVKVSPAGVATPINDWPKEK